MESGSSNNNTNSSGSTTTNPSKTLTTLFNFDLTKTPPPSPLPNDDVADQTHEDQQPTMVVCVVCVKHFLENPLSEKESEEEKGLCGECSTKCHRRKRVKRVSCLKQDYKIGGVFDMNASPPSEADGDDVALMMKMELGDIKYVDLLLDFGHISLD